MTINPTRLFKDPSKLTPYEERLLALRDKGLTFKQISEALGGTSSPASVTARFKIIREKMEIMEYEKGSRKSA